MAIPIPTNVAEVEQVSRETRSRYKCTTDTIQLVLRFYSPNNPKVIAEIDDHLKAIQRSHEGWQIADALLGSQDRQVRFFGALTFQVKLNNDGSVSRP